MRIGWACLGFVAVCSFGCDRAIDQFLDELKENGGATGGMGMAGMGAGGMAGMGAGGVGVAGMGAGGMAGAGGAAGGPMACGTFTVGTAMTLAPSAAGQAYARCDTLGPEQGWLAKLSPSGDRLVARTAAGTIRLISTATWTEVPAQLASPVGELDAMAFSPDGARLATLSEEEGEVTLWGTEDGAYQESFATPPAATIDANGASLAFSSNGQRLATSTGLVIDLVAGTKTSWMTGAPDTTMLVTNPENLTSIDNGGVPLIRFTALDSKLFVVTNYEIGNSPTATRLELRDPVTGAQTVLFNMFSRALLGYAISDDGRYVAWSATAEDGGAPGLFGPGMWVVDATTGAKLASDPTSTTTSVLAFSHDGGSIFAQNGATIDVVGSTDLHAISSFTWPTGTTFVAVSPNEDLLGMATGSTSYFDPSSGAVVRTLPFPLTSAFWTADGAFAVGSGDSSALFHLWTESNGAQLCSPPAGTGSAPAISSLGTTIPVNRMTSRSLNTTVMSTDGSVTGTEMFLIHGHATNFYADSLSVTSSGALLRQFGALADGIDPRPFLAISTPDAAKAYTPAVTAMQSPGPDLAVWCR